MKIKYVIVFILGLNYTVLTAQPVNLESLYLKFDLLTKRNGLTSNRITDIYQDKLGFMWFATDHGLNRYDGYSMESFTADTKDSTTLSGNIVTCITEDKFGHLWVGTNKGLNQFDPINHHFKHFHLSDSTETGDFVRTISADSMGNLWIETADGYLHHRNIKSGEKHRYKHQPPVQITTYFYHAIFEEKNDKIWIGGRAMGPYQFDKTTKKFKFHPSKPANPNGKNIKDITFFYRDKTGIFWVGGIDGLYIFDRNKDTFTKFLSVSAFDMIEDKDGVLWIATGKGIRMFDREKNTLTAIRPDPNNSSALPSDHITRLFVDKAKNIWIGTMEGICKYSPWKNKFRYFYHIPEEKTTPSSNHITAILETTNGKIILGTDDTGIDILDANFIRITNYNTTPKNRIHLAANRVSSLYEDKYGSIWIGLWAGKGFHQFDLKNQQIKHFSLEKDNTKVDWYNDFVEDDFGNFWISTWSSYGLFKFDRATGSFIDKEEKPGCKYTGLSSRFLSRIMADEAGFLWVGTTNDGLNRMNIQTLTVEQFPDNREDSTAFWGEGVTCLFEDTKHKIWIGGHGLNRFDNQNQHFRHYTTKDGLADNTVMGMLEDDENNLWISTQKGLSKFDPRKNLFTNYFEKDGLPDNEFTHACWKFHDERLAFGTKKGFIVFRPDELKNNETEPQLTITSFKLFEEPYKRDFSGKKTIKLSHRQNHLTFEFAALDFSNSGSNHFSYRLKGFEDNWTTTDATNRRAKYTNLSPGDYTFLLKGSNTDDTWSKEPLTIDITITPPFWKTWWFILLEILAVGITIFLFIRSREKKLKAKHQAELMEQKLLRSQMNPHFIFNALGAIQSYIFSHNPIEAGTYLSRFADLMRSILYSSREEFISLEKELTTLRNYLSIQQLRFENRFDYHFQIDDSLNTDFILVPPMLVQPFIENAIEHGLRDLDRQGVIITSVKKNGNKLVFTVEDNGIGIQNNKISNKNHQSLAIKIIKERLEILNKENKGNYTLKIENITTNEGKTSGTKVTFYIPFRSVT